MSINGISIVNNVPFQGKTEAEVDYKPSTIGVNLGIGLPIVGFAAYDVIKNGGFKKCWEMVSKEPQKLASFDLKYSIISLVGGIGLGYLVDYYINKSRRQKAEAAAKFNAQA